MFQTPNHAFASRAPRPLRTFRGAARIALLAAAILPSSGCAGWWDWPSQGGGGYAEMAAIGNPRIQAQGDEIAEFEQRGAATYAASDLAEAQLLLLRVQRGFMSGMIADTEIDMDKLDLVIDSMRRRMARHDARSPRASRT